MNGFDKSDLPTAKTPTVLSVSSPKITWEPVLVTDLSQPFVYKIEGNIGSTADPVWITVADQIAKAEINFNGDFDQT